MNLEYLILLETNEAKLVLTSEVPVHEIFAGEDPIKMGESEDGDHGHVDSHMRSLMDDLGIPMDTLLESSIFVGRCVSC
jgi:peroxisome-assembly ATPase